MMGVYRFTINSQIYVGSSKDIDKRFKKHMGLLSRGKHGNKKFQEAFNKTKDFSFYILEKNVEIKDLTTREQYWIDYYRFSGSEMLNLALIVIQPKKVILPPKYRTNLLDFWGA